MNRRLPLLIPVVLLATGLAACTPITAALGGGSATRSATATAVPQPSGTPVAPRPTIGPASCTITAPGASQAPDCPALIIRGEGITVTAGRAGSIQVEGDHDQVLADAGASVHVQGQDNQIVVGGDVGGIEIHGDRNEIDAQGRIGSGRIEGNDNVVKAAGGVGDIVDDGARNSIGAQP